MAHDNELTSASFPLDQVPLPVDFSQYTPIGNYLEPELKVAIPLGKVRSIHSNDLPIVKPAFQALAELFNSSSKKGYSVVDRNGVSPRDYVLVSLGQDTFELLPTMKIRQEGLQYRERFALTVFADDIRITKYDANAKTLLSSLEAGMHRKEYEVEVSSPLQGFHEFRQIPDLPVFFNEIAPDSLRIESICMTSRVSFFSLTHIPGTNLMAALEHCCDISRHTTPNMDVYVNKVPDCEWETEVKGFYGQDPRLSTERGQSELVNTLFTCLTSRFKKAVPGFILNTHSKLERASYFVNDHYLTHGPFKKHSANNSPFASHCNEQGLPLGLAYALTQKVPAQNAYKDPSRLIALAQNLPDPARVLDEGPLLDTGYGRRDLALACG